MTGSEIIVIQCAASKRNNAGHLRLGDGRKVLFVARPDRAPEDGAYVFAHPDGATGTGGTWRETLLRYNAAFYNAAFKDDPGAPGGNPCLLLPAWQLYRHPVYTRLWDEYGPERLYILSAGWGLIRSDFLVPNYDITFSNSAEPYKRKRVGDSFDYWSMLPDDTTNPVVFFGGKSYIKLFCELTGRIKGPRYIYYNSLNPPDAPGCCLRKFDTTTRTNWHYECAQEFMKGSIGISPSF